MTETKKAPEKKPAAKKPAAKKAPETYEFTDHDLAFGGQLAAQLHVDRVVAVAYAQQSEAQDGEDMASQVSRVRAEYAADQLEQLNPDEQAKKLKVKAAAIDAARDYLAHR